MKHINIYSGLAVMLLMLVANTVHAEVVGLQSDAECISDKITNDLHLSKMLSDLSAQTPKSQITSSPYYTDYYDAKNGRYVFCMDNTKKDASVFAPLILKNTSTYPVVIYGLNIDSTLTNSNASLLTVQGTGEIVLQNLATKNDIGPVGLKGPILFQGKTTLLDSTISCDVANTAPAITVSSTNNTFRRVTINECSMGLGITGSFNNFYEVAVNKTATDESQVGGWGVTSTGANNSFFALMVKNYKGGAMLWGSGNRIFGMPAAEGTVNALKTVDGKFVIPSAIIGFTTETTIPASSPGESDTVVKNPLKDSIGVYFKSKGALETSKVDGVERGVIVLANNVYIQRNFELGGSLGAVVIGHDPITDKAYQPVTVSKNKFVTKETIAYLDATNSPTDPLKSPYRLLGVEWMGKHVPEGADYADRIVGKLLDQNNGSTLTELVIGNKADQEFVQFAFWQTCKVGPSTVSIDLVARDEKGEIVDKKTIAVGDKIFECLTNPDGTPLKEPLKSHVRAYSNTSTISNMSEDVTLAQLHDIHTVLVGATSSLPIGSGDLADTGNVGNVPTGATPPPPSDIHDVGDNSGNSNNMVTGATGLDAGIPTVAGSGAEMAGAQGLVGSLTSGGGCSLTTAIEGQGNAASALIWLLALLPIPILLPMRNRKK